MYSEPTSATSNYFGWPKNPGRFLNPNGDQLPSHSKRKHYENTITNLHRVVRARYGRDRPDSHSRVCCGAIFSNANGFAGFNDNGIADSNG